MKTKKLWVVMVLLCSVVGVSRAADPLNQADSAYNAGNYIRAIQLYDSLVASGYESATLYYNLGNAYYKNDQVGRAVLNFRRALGLDPSMEDARYNLEVASSRAIDKIDIVPEFFMVSYTRSVRELMSTNGWAAWAIGWFLVALAGAVVWLSIYSLGWRKAGFATMIVSLVLSVVGLWAAWGSYDRVSPGTWGVVVHTATPVVSAPNAEGKDLFVLHEGTTLDVLDRSGEWVEVQIASGEKGWVKAEGIETN